MRKYLTVIPALLSGLALAAAAPAPAAAAGRGTTASIASTQARFGGGFRASRPSFGSRYRAPAYRRPSSYRRAHPFRGLGGSILRALGIAFLLHALFGWGAGGSPLGLLIVVALIAWIATRRRRSYSY